ncbi:MAG: M56 family metallopeptidase [Bacteroides sp.]|nr:M56 family metallopeptidase [Bacteroides sp.]
MIYNYTSVQAWTRNQEPLLEIAQLYATAFLPEIEAGPQGVAVNHWWQLIPSLLFYIYLAGVVLLSIRLLIQLSGIILLNRRCNKEKIREIEVRILEKEAGPFSFFKWIFICPFKHNREEMDEILLHEQTHANQWHSIDVLLSELVTIFFWFNPFVWLTKREIRNNLEYLADQKVIDSGYDSKKYQYHLLELTQKQVTTPLYNSFKILPLKNRIRMMNKERTRNILRTKYLAIIPLIIVLLVISNIETIARSTIHIAKDVMEKAETHNEPFAAEEEVITAKTDIGPEVEVMQLNNEAPAPSLVEEEVFMIVEQMPEYPGGMSGLIDFLRKNIHYPVEALKAGIEGRVIVQFVVEKAEV